MINHFRRRHFVAAMAALGLAGSFAAMPVQAASDDRHSAHMERMDKRFDQLRSDLGLSEQQKPLWERFEAALKAERSAMQERMAPAMKNDAIPAPERVQLMQQMMSARADSLKSVSEAMKPLYESLSAEQRAKLDRFFTHGHGGSRHGMMEQGFKPGFWHGRNWG